MKSEQSAHIEMVRRAESNTLHVGKHFAAPLARCGTESRGF